MESTFQEPWLEGPTPCQEPSPVYTASGTVTGRTCTVGWSVRYLQTAWESFELDVDAVTASALATPFYTTTSSHFPNTSLAPGSSRAASLACNVIVCAPSLCCEQSLVQLLRLRSDVRAEDVRYTNRRRAEIPGLQQESKMDAKGACGCEP